MNEKHIANITPPSENVNNASADDVRRLIALVQETVRGRFGTQLELVVWTVGE